MEIQITKEESLILLEEMQEDENKICPNCNGILLWRRGKVKRKSGFGKDYKYTCKECGKAFMLNPINPKIRGEVAKFLINNLMASPQDLSNLIRKYFKTTISRQTIWLFKKFIKENGGGISPTTEVMGILPNML